MKPVSFPESNKTLTKPVGMTDEECMSLEVFTNGEQVISQWKPDWRDRLRLLFGKPIWLSCWSGHTAPPVRVMTEYPFLPPDDPRTHGVGAA